MKRILLIATVLVSTLSIAQEKITEGMYSLLNKPLSSTNEQINMQLAMMGEMISTTYFKNGKG